MKGTLVLATVALLITFGWRCGLAQAGATSLNQRVIIGVLAEERHDSDQQYIAASYVKYIEAAGARVVSVFDLR